MRGELSGPLRTIVTTPPCLCCWRIVVGASSLVQFVLALLLMLALAPLLMHC